MQSVVAALQCMVVAVQFCVDVAVQCCAGPLRAGGCAVRRGGSALHSRGSQWGDFTEVCWAAVNVGEDCPVFDGLFDFCQVRGRVWEGERDRERERGRGLD